MAGELKTMGVVILCDRGLRKILPQIVKYLRKVDFHNGAKGIYAGKNILVFPTHEVPELAICLALCAFKKDGLTLIP